MSALRLTKLSQKNADDTDNTDLRRYDFFDMSNYKHFNIRENQRYPCHPRSKMPYNLSFGYPISSHRLNIYAIDFSSALILKVGKLQIQKMV